ncbi:Glycerophosphocholine phosphodiesterase [Savitreella phatthalungensis]
MKFGKNLNGNKVPEFAAHYVNYKGLKKIIKDISLKADQGLDLTPFFYELDINVDDIEDFFLRKVNEGRRRLTQLESHYKSAKDSKKQHDLPSDEWEELVAATVDLRGTLQKLMWFSEVNKQGVVKILKKLDKKLDICVKETYLKQRIEHLGFARPVGVEADLQKVNRWLSQLVPTDLKHLTLTASSEEDNSRRVRAMVNLGLEENEANAFESLIEHDDAAGVLKLIEERGSEPANAIELNLAQQAILARANAVAKTLIKRLTSLTLVNDINGRNLIHKLVIVQGRRISKGTAPEKGSPLADDMFITPALPPSNVSLGKPAVEFGSRTRDSLTEDDPRPLKFLLETLPDNLRPALAQPDAQGRLPLHYAAEYGLEVSSQLLVAFMQRWKLLGDKACLEQTAYADIDGLTPVHLAVKNRYPVTLGVLLNARNLQDHRNIELRKVTSNERNAPSALMLAVGAPELIRILLDAGLDINARNAEGETCLHHAARLGNLPSIEELLRERELQSADLLVTEKTYGWTPLFVAAVEGHEEVLERLVQASNQECLDKVDLSGWTAMEHAVFRGHIRCGKILKPSKPPGPANFFEGMSRPTLHRDQSWRGIFEDAGSAVANNDAGVRSFGHRYLRDKCMIIVTLGSTDTRQSRNAIQLDKVPIAEAGTTRLDTALSLVVSAKHADGDATTFDLPFNDSPTTEPILFTAKDPSKVQLYFDIVPTYAASGSKKLGRAVALLNSIKTKVGSHRSSLWGAVTLPIVESEQLGVIGTVEFEFSVVTPFAHQAMTIEKESTYWKSLMTTRVIGHRGLGKNFPDRKSLQLGENTVQSFVAAANLGASYVEFDVQLTKDLVPVLYHDFLVSQTGLDAPVHSLTLAQFMSAVGNTDGLGGPNGSGSGNSSTHLSRVGSPEATVLADGSTRTFGPPRRSRSVSSEDFLNGIERMKHTRDFRLKGFKGNQRGHSVQDAFTTLKEVFRKVPKGVGFNIECKYPMLNEAEDEEMEHTAIEINEWVDTVLRCVYDHGDGRDIIFSSFHPDICLLLSLKQPSIPCLFLTESGTSYMCDVRSSSLQEAIRFASRWNLLGIVSACEPLVLCPRLVRVVKESGLVCVSYGVLNNDPDNVNAQVKAGVDAVIVDSVLAVRKGLTAAQAADQPTLLNQTIAEHPELSPPIPAPIAVRPSQ